MLLDLRISTGFPGLASFPKVAPRWESPFPGPRAAQQHQTCSGRWQGDGQLWGYWPWCCPVWHGQPGAGVVHAMSKLSCVPLRCSASNTIRKTQDRNGEKALSSSRNPAREPGSAPYSREAPQTARQLCGRLLSSRVPPTLLGSVTASGKPAGSRHLCLWTWFIHQHGWEGRSDGHSLCSPRHGRFLRSPWLGRAGSDACFTAPHQSRGARLHPVSAERWGQMK